MPIIYPFAVLPRELWLSVLQSLTRVPLPRACECSLLLLKSYFRLLSQYHERKQRTTDACMYFFFV